MSFTNWFNSIVNNNPTFSIEGDPSTKTITIQEKDNQFNSLRVEMSEYKYPYFFKWESNKKFSYNHALALVINSGMNNCTYINELSDYIKRITNHRVYQASPNKNLSKKDENAYVFVSEEFLPNFDISKPEMRQLADKYPIQPASEKSIGDGIFTLSASSLYEGVGYYYENGKYKCLFPNKSNLAARLKSFFLPNSVNLVNPSVNLFKDGDKNTQECLVVFVRPGKERHVSGEIWIGDKFNNTLFTVLKREWYSDTNINIGDKMKAKDFKLSSPFGENNSYSNAKTIECIDKNPLYLRLKVTYRLNESRITSNTGLKGYSVIKDNLGELNILSDVDGLYSGNIVPDMICGPSSMKGKVNQVRLAQALYVAKHKYSYKEGELDSMDVDLINRLADECPKGKWTDPEGVEHDCYYGLINIAFTDPSIQYSKNGKMGFQFEMLKLAMLEYPKLATAILDSRESDDMETVKEIIYLEQSLEGNVIKGFKTFTDKMINNYSNQKSITINRINSLEVLPVQNYLLEKDRKPFIYQLANGKKVYIPSGKALSVFQSCGANGSWLYDVLIVQLSRIFGRGFTNTEGLARATKRWMSSIGNNTVVYPKLYGLNMKQTTLYNHAMSVSVPSKNLKEAKYKIFKGIVSDDEIEDQELYALVVRNPAIWRNQLCICKVVDGGNCSTVGLSHDVVMRERADNDGDLAPVYFGNPNIQECLAELYDHQFQTTLVEKEWEEAYYAAESDSELFDDMLTDSKNKYKLYSFTSSDLKNRLFDAAIAKTTVGVGTTQYWAWSDAVNLYYNHYSNSTITLGGEKVKLRNMTDDVRKELISLYAIILQSFVIGAIKHSEGGSTSYQRFLLERIGNNSEKKNILNSLVEEMPFCIPKKDSSSYEDNLKGQVINMLFYVASLFNRSRLDFFSETSRMYGHFNGGKELDSPLSDDCKKTIFYEIVSFIDDCRKECKPQKAEGFVRTIVEDPF